MGSVMLCCGGGSQGITVAPSAGGRGLANGVPFQPSGSRQSAEGYSDTVRLAIGVFYSRFLTLLTILNHCFRINFGFETDLSDM